MESGFYKVRPYDSYLPIGADFVFAAVWNDADKLALHDARLGSRRSAHDNHWEARIGYQAIRYGMHEADNANLLERLELMPVASIEYEGETLAEHCGGSYIGIIPRPKDGWGGHYCGGEVVASIYLAGHDHEGLPYVRRAYISRCDYGEHNGKLVVAIPA